VFDLSKRVIPIHLLDLVFPNFANLSADLAEYGAVKPYYFRHPLFFGCAVPVRRHEQSVNVPYSRPSAGDYTVLYIALSTHDWRSLYKCC
jgi:hypothetical protein